MADKLGESEVLTEFSSVNSNHNHMHSSLPIWAFLKERKQRRAHPIKSISLRGRQALSAIHGLHICLLRSWALGTSSSHQGHSPTNSFIHLLSTSHRPGTDWLSVGKRQTGASAQSLLPQTRDHLHAPGTISAVGMER